MFPLNFSWSSLGGAKKNSKNRFRMLQKEKSEGISEYRKKADQEFPSDLKWLKSFKKWEPRQLFAQKTTSISRFSRISGTKKVSQNFDLFGKHKLFNIQSLKTKETFKQNHKSITQSDQITLINQRNWNGMCFIA